ncbi:MAG: BON domain-containing protein [Bryobacterales bacterium]|nr:BON domain-containing protein [Bryobacterales bacterium]
MHSCLRRAAAALVVVYQAAAADQTIVQRIQKSFAQSKLRDEHFIVKLEGEAVILEGRTRISQHKGTATRLAKNAGASNVINRIEVQSGEKSTPMRRAIVLHE